MPEFHSCSIWAVPLHRVLLRGVPELGPGHCISGIPAAGLAALPLAWSSEEPVVIDSLGRL